jgi:hypothetical protein
MKYINQNSNRGIVNKFADFIVKEIIKENNTDAVIEVTDCGKFFVVNGMTNSDKLLDISSVKQKFIDENKTLLTEFGYETLNVVDLIMYNVELVKKDEYWFTFYNSSRPIYHNKVINFVENESNDLMYNSVEHNDTLSVEIDFSEEKTKKLPYYTNPPLNITSEYPFGYSLNMGRNFLYFSEYIAHNLFSVIKTDTLIFKMSSRLNSDRDYDIEIKTNSIYSNEDIKSMVLDTFDFNLIKFNKSLSNYDLYDDLAKPFELKSWIVKDKISDLTMF